MAERRAAETEAALVQTKSKLTEAESVKYHAVKRRVESGGGGCGGGSGGGGGRGGGGDGDGGVGVGVGGGGGSEAYLARGRVRVHDGQRVVLGHVTGLRCR